MSADLKYIELCACQIARVANSNKIVVEKPTLPVLTAESLKVILESEDSEHTLNTISGEKIAFLGWAFEPTENSHAIAVLTERDEFKVLDWERTKNV